MYWLSKQSRIGTAGHRPMAPRIMSTSDAVGNRAHTGPYGTHGRAPGHQGQHHALRLRDGRLTENVRNKNGRVTCGFEATERDSGHR